MSDIATKPLHLMVDIETLSTRPTAAILAIGAVFFDIDTGKLTNGGAHIRVSLESAAAYGHIDGATLGWWFRQSREAQNATLCGSLDINRALLILSNYIYDHVNRSIADGVPADEQLDHLRVWSKGPAFDLAILEYAYRNRQMMVPWSYRAHRDVRTMLDLPGLVLPERDAALVEHCALDDAIYQAQCVSAAYAQITRRKPMEAAHG